MRPIRLLAVAAVVLAMAGWPSIGAAGLYDDDAKNAIGGDLKSQDYWWAKFDDMMLDRCIKEHQPEGRIGLQLATSVKRLDYVAKHYPKDVEIQDMKKQEEEIQAKIDPNASRTSYFGPECPWEESNFAQLWVNLHWAKAAYAAKDYNTALSCMQNVEQNYEIMLRPDRMKDYPEDLRKWVQDSKGEADTLYKEVKEKTNS